MILIEMVGWLVGSIAASMFAQSYKAPCPMCRSVAQKRTLCTFDCVRKPPPSAKSKVTTTKKKDAGKKSTFFGSKIAALVRAIEQILTENPTDKILIFAQWEGLLSEISRALVEFELDCTVLSTDNMSLVRATAWCCSHSRNRCWRYSRD